MPRAKPRALVIVADGQNALFLDLTGRVLHPHLRLRKAIRGGENPATHEQGSDRPGRAFQSVGRMRSAMEQTDWHELGEMRFVAQVISELEVFIQANSSQKLILIAPPRILSYLRQQLPRSTQQRVQAEFDKDLVQLPLYEIERHLVSH